MQIKTNWNIDEYLITDSTENVINGFNSNIENFLNKWSGVKFKKSNLLEYLSEQEFIYKPLYDLYIHTNLTLSTDSTNQEASKLKSRISDTLDNASNTLSNLSDKFKNDISPKLDSIIKDKKFKSHKNYLKNYQIGISHDLGAEKETLLRSGDSVSSIFQKLYNEYSSSLMFEYRGELLTESAVRAKRMSDDESERKDATESISKVYNNKQNKIIFGNLYSSVCKKWTENVKNRKYNSPISIQNYSEEMSDKSVDKLLSGVRELYPLYHEFLKKKAKILKKKKLDFWDIFAPYPIKGKDWSFEEGLEFYLSKIKEFDQEFYDYSVDMIESERVSVFPKEGKRGGAFAMYNKDVPSFVLLNWVNTSNDIMTLAHEFGHAIHGNLSQCQNSYSFSSPLCLAETASIFNETLIFESIIETASEEEKKSLLIEKLDDIFSTIFRQVMYVSFEKRCHDEYMNGNNLTQDDFDNIWFEEMSLLYGDSVNITKEDAFGWSSIPHIYHTPFYCYSYAFGNIVSLQLYSLYKNSDDKEQFKTMYKNILKSGGSKRPKKLMRENGIDMNSMSFGETIKSLIDEL